MNNKIILSTAYFGNIQYYSKLVNYNNIEIEVHENFTKQSYRNRTEILGANGKLALTIPVKKGRSIKIPINELELDYSENWMNTHWRSIESAYRHSAFFEYYVDYIEPIFDDRPQFLLEFNNTIQSTILDILEIDNEIKETTEFVKVPDGIDFRDAIHPKARMQKEDVNFIAPEYFQVFANKFGFTPNLSILDLLFNCGPSTTEILMGTFNRFE